MDWLIPPAPETVDHSSLASLVVSSSLRDMSFRNQRALGVAAIYRARQLNADTLASLPVKAGDSLVPAPNKYQDTQEFVSEIILSLEDHGEAYLRTVRGETRVLDPNLMVVDWNKARTRRVYTYDGKQMRTWGLDAPLIVLSLNRTASDLVGKGPMQSSRIQGLIAQMTYEEDFFLNQAQPTGLLSHPGVLTAAESKAFLEQWQAGQQKRSTGVLSGGLEYRPMSFNPSDSEMTDQHLVGITDVATLFGIPSVLLNHAVQGSSLTYQTISDVWQAYYRATLKPTYGRRIEGALSRILGQPVRFDPEELFLASLTARTNAAATLVRSGYDAAESLDVAGLPPMQHQGWVPTTVYDPAEVSDNE
jgi:HK97 family phage portal protein